MTPEMELYYLCDIGKSTARLERCLARKPDVNKPNEMGVTALMFAAAAWSVPFVRRLLEEKADPNAEDRNGATAMNIVDQQIASTEAAADAEREDCRKRRLAMEVTGTLLYDRPNVEELEPFTFMPRLYEVKSILEQAGGRASDSVRRPGYD
uniref:Uncharacterized protein n=1 Tax=Zooxanthella nutricula TaxID=1333877 RepID=A0A7S2VGS5_9DINO